MLLAAARRSVAALSANVGIARAFAARSRGEASVPAITVYQVGDQVFYWRGVSKAKSAWAHRWHGPGVIIGLEQNNLWISHRGAVIKASSRHVRPAQSDELVPWHSIYEKASRGNQLPPPTPETEMPALSTGEQPSYLDMSVDNWQRPPHDQPEIDPETGLPTEPGWIHRPYAGRGRRGRTWIRAELQPQPEH
jgi:hypothetical protein